MKCKVLIGFCDKYTGKTYKEGETYTFTTERGSELLTDPRQLVEEVAEEKPKKKTSKKEDK